MSKYDKYINALRKCAKEHEKEITFTGYIIVSDLCRDTANLLEEVKQESTTDVLDKIKADIETVIQEETVVNMNGGEYEHIESKLDPDDVFQIIDKYKAESEEV